MRISDWSSDVCSSDLTVIMQENCAREGDTLRLTAEPPAPGRDIRVRGSDFSEHALLVARGARMTPAAIALAIMGGHGTVPVHRRTRIALISTGDELAAPGAITVPHQIPASNGPMLAALHIARAHLFTPFPYAHLFFLLLLFYLLFFFF